MTSAFFDYLNGAYPQYSKSLFADDIFFSISNKTRDFKLKKVYLTPRLYDDEVRDYLEARLHQVHGPEVEVVKDDTVSVDEGVRIDLEEKNDQYEDFVEFLNSNAPEMRCSEKDFRMLRLFDMYLEFRSK